MSLHLGCPDVFIMRVAFKLTKSNTYYQALFTHEQPLGTLVLLLFFMFTDKQNNEWVYMKTLENVILHGPLLHLL